MDQGIRVYALIIGPVLPDKKTRIGRCFIEPMSLAEQKKRKFKPLKKVSKIEPDTFHKSYVATSDNEFDQRIIKTGYVIYTEVDNLHWETAINIAYQIFEEVVGALSIRAISERSLANRIVTDFYSYDYQIVKLYRFDGEDEEPIKTEKFSGAGYQKLNFPRESFIDRGLSSVDIESLISRSNHNPNLKSAIEYLMFAERCKIFRLPTENTVLNLCKSMESLLQGMSFNKKITTFKDKVKDANNIFELDEHELSEIFKLWDVRSREDIAHASEKYIFSHFYISTVPTSKNKMIVIMNQPAIVAKMIKKYSDFINTFLHIKVQKYQKKEGRYEELIYVSNRGYFTYQSNLPKGSKLTIEIKRRISNDLKVPYKNIKKYSERDKEFLFRVESFKFERRTSRMSYIVFGR
jgi:hypothetical protein